MLFGGPTFISSRISTNYTISREESKKKKRKKRVKRVVLFDKKIKSIKKNYTSFLFRRKILHTFVGLGGVGPPPSPPKSRYLENFQLFNIGPYEYDRQKRPQKPEEFQKFQEGGGEDLSGWP